MMVGRIRNWGGGEGSESREKGERSKGKWMQGARTSKCRAVISSKELAFWPVTAVKMAKS